MSTYKFSDAVTTMWPFPPAKITAAYANAWPFPKSKPEEGTSADTELENQEIDLDEGISAVNEIEDFFDRAHLIAQALDEVSATSYFEQAVAEGVKFCSANSSFFPMRGISVAYRKCGMWNNSRMVEVAVVYCSKHDSFNKKVGRELVAKQFMQNKVVMVPARSKHADHTIPYNLLEMFWYNTMDAQV